MYDPLRKLKPKESGSNSQQRQPGLKHNLCGGCHQNHLSSTSRTHMGGCPNSQAKGKQHGWEENFTGNTAMRLQNKKYL